MIPCPEDSFGHGIASPRGEAYGFTRLSEAEIRIAKRSIGFRMTRQVARMRERGLAEPSPAESMAVRGQKGRWFPLSPRAGRGLSTPCRVLKEPAGRGEGRFRRSLTRRHHAPAFACASFAPDKGAQASPRPRRGDFPRHFIPQGQPCRRGGRVVARRPLPRTRSDLCLVPCCVPQELTYASTVALTALRTRPELEPDVLFDREGAATEAARAAMASRKSPGLVMVVLPGGWSWFEVCNLSIETASR